MTGTCPIDGHEPGGRYDFSQWLTWVALQMIEELGPSISAAELLDKYRHHMRGELPPVAASGCPGFEGITYCCENCGRARSSHPPEGGTDAEV